MPVSTHIEYIANTTLDDDEYLEAPDNKGNLVVEFDGEVNDDLLGMIGCNTRYLDKVKNKYAVQKLIAENLERTDLEELFDALSRNASIKTLDLSGTNLGDDGAIALANVIKQNKFLPIENLILTGCGIGDEGFIEICRANKKHKTLESLDVSYNNITNEGWFASFAMFKESPHKAFDVNLLGNDKMECSEGVQKTMNAWRQLLAKHDHGNKVRPSFEDYCRQRAMAAAVPRALV